MNSAYQEIERSLDFLIGEPLEGFSLILDYLQLQFFDGILTLYCEKSLGKIDDKVDFSDDLFLSKMRYLIGTKVVSTVSNDNEILLEFENGFILSADLNSETIKGKEAATFHPNCNNRVAFVW
jgi:hypothetical protein